MTRIMMRQARLLGEENWTNVGPVSHAEAAKRYGKLKFNDAGGIGDAFVDIETRCIDAPAGIMMHRVKRRVEYTVISRRGDKK